MGFSIDRTIVAGNTLIAEAIQSQNFLTGVAGWMIAANGDIELNNAVIRGILRAGVPPSYIEVTNNIPAELTTFYGAGGVTIFGAYIRMQLNDFGYMYMIVGADANTAVSELSFATGFVVLPSLALVETNRILFDPATNTVREQFGFANPYQATYFQSSGMNDHNGHDVLFGESGTKLVTFAAATAFSVVVPFSVGFDTQPVVMVNLASGPATALLWQARAIAVTTTQFTLQLNGPSAMAFTNFPVQWLAFQKH